ncbi:multidrug effflux MFS transporter [Demequina salsinemoris]|uniref:multidrug effflux MFS transporter n=1 Tax=Demequina salsinemoris TaxID=577470 RepID=UPI0007824372
MTDTTTTARAHAPARPSKAVGTAMLGALALLAAVTPLATDLYLPAFPTMASDLSTTSAGVQLSLTAFMIGAGVGQVVFGPLSDRVGRRVPLLVGTVAFLLASVGAALAPTIGLLIALRVLQGLGGAAGMVIGRAVIADRAHGAEAVKAQTLMMLVGGVAPVVAPLLGSFLADTIGWRGLLGVLAVVGLACVVAVIALVPETRPAEKRHSDLTVRQETRMGLSALRNRAYLGNTAAFAFAFATMMAYISASPFVYQDLIGLGTVQYGLAFGLNALLIMVTSAIAANLTGRVPTRRLAGVGLAITLIAVVALVAVAASSAPAWTLMIPVAFAIAPLGLVFGSTTALALDSAPEAPGMASAALGLGQFALAGLVAPLVSVGGEGTALPMAIVMLAAAVLANVALRAAGRGADTLDA